MQPNQLNGLTLAYIGDCFYELKIRQHFINIGLTKVNDLHKNVIKLTCAEFQSKLIMYMQEKLILTEEEIAIFKRGRNSNCMKTRKNLSKTDYLNATGFESLIGYLYLNNNIEKIDEICAIAINMKEGILDGE
ncbi:MAG: Mini-ribonuclease 3 [Anaeroplasmataceae bacterium]